MLTYSTYLGGSGDEGCSAITLSVKPGCPAIAVDSAGNAYVAGPTTSPDFPIPSGTTPFQASPRGAADIFVTKLNSTGTALIFATYLGGTGADVSAGVAADSGFNVVVAGTTNSPDFPTNGTNAAFQPTPLSAGTHAFVSKLDSLDNWVRFPGSQASSHKNQFAPDGRLDWPFLVKGPAVIYEATSAAPVGELMKPYRTVRQQQGKEGTEWPMSAEAAVGPAILVNHLGKGTVLTFAGSPDSATASEHHIVETRKLLRKAVRFLNPTPRIEITAPANVEAVVTDDPATRTLRVRFIAYNSPPQTMPRISSMRAAAAASSPVKT